MSDPQPIASPCIGVCVLDENDLCIGCARTETEIANWTQFTPDEREGIMNQLDDRLEAL